MFIFFFKQKTAYEMRISDWSSDVCSADLHAGVSFTAPGDYESEGLGYKLDYRVEGTQGDLDYPAAASWQTQGMFYDANGDLIGVDDTQGDVKIGRASCRERVCPYE